MFKWIKFLHKLSSEDSLIEKMDLQIKKLQEDIAGLEKKKQECQEFLAKYEENLKKTQTETENMFQKFESFSGSASAKIAEVKECGEKYSRDGNAALNALNQEITEKMAASKKAGEEVLAKMETAVNEGSRLATDKLQSIKDEAEKYAATLADQIGNYENNFDEFNKKLADLKDAILNLQR